MKRKYTLILFLTMIALLVQACNLPFPAEPTATPIPPTETSAPPSPTEESAPPEVQHLTFPASASIATLTFDVDSSPTAPEKRAPYGDSYDINRLERPFLQDMSYVLDLDIKNFSLNSDADWYYISMKLVGTEPNNSLGINYGVEFDTDRDGFGDFLVIASPPYATEWKTENVFVYADKNHNTSGASPTRADAPYSADGYESLIFDGGQPGNEDPDLAWVRIDADPNATVQFAVKRSLVGDIFMYGVLADAGFKDVSMMDYVDRFSEADAGSPVRDKPYYPLKELYAFDNTCRQAYGFTASGYEPMICPKEPPPTGEPGVAGGCTNPSSYGDQASCEAAGCRLTFNPNTIAAVVYYCTYP